MESTVFGDLEERLAMADKKLSGLQARMIAVSGDEAAVDALGDQIDALREERQCILAKAAECSDLQERMNDMISFLTLSPVLILSLFVVYTEFSAVSGFAPECPFSGTF